MNIFIEGPYWCGMWTEIIADALQQAGHHTGISYHNRKKLSDRVALAGRRLLSGETRKAAWVQRHRRQLCEAMSHEQWDILLSIQGTIDEQTLQQCRRHSPGLEVIFWWGDILTELGHARIGKAAAFAKRLLVSDRGTFDQLSPVYPDQLHYFPFGVSRRFHTVNDISAPERERFSADVVLVGTCYPARCELIRYLNARLDTPVTAWGRGWRHCKGIRGHGALSLADSLKVHACAKVSLNLHHVETNNGFNMKFYEIPAAGGFQICDWQPLLETTALGRQTVACRSLEEFAEKINYYLANANAQERQQLASTASQTVFATEYYPSKLDAIFNNLAQITHPFC